VYVVLIYLGFIETPEVAAIFNPVLCAVPCVRSINSLAILKIPTTPAHTVFT